MLTNEQFLEVIRRSFEIYLDVNTSRSTKKLKPLHGYIAKDLEELFSPGYEILSQGHGADKEGRIPGRYYPKTVDITVMKDGKPIAGYAVKFVMRNYSQNSNNYFENMLGETANIRANKIPYFQILVILEKIPYYDKDGIFCRYNKLTKQNLKKYLILSKDEPDMFFHTPDKTLIVIVRLKEKTPDHHYTNSDEYASYYKSVIRDRDLLSYSTNFKDDEFDNGVILNDYQNFIQRTYHIVRGKQK